MASSPIRPAAVAGHFYPADPHLLAAHVQILLNNSRDAEPIRGVPKALIVPHAGYVYSGAVAASAYGQLESRREVIRRVVLLGPSHRVPFNGMALPACTAFATPLGTVEVDHEAALAIAEMPGVVYDDRPHAEEHSLEVQLPFLQSIFDHFRILPLVLGNVNPQQVASVIEKLWGGEETLFLISSDLSHYQPYPEARNFDSHTVSMVLEGRAELRPDQACGATGINAILHSTQQHHLVAQLLDCRNSGDTAGDRSRVVGYAAIAFAPEVRTAH